MNFSKCCKFVRIGRLVIDNPFGKTYSKEHPRKFENNIIYLFLKGSKTFLVPISSRLPS